MDINKIITDSLYKSLKEVASGKFDNHANGFEGQDAMLINYINILLTTYHKELKKELAKHDIEI